MTRNTLVSITVALATIAIQADAGAQAASPKLHVNPRWSECSFQLDAALTKAAWRQFTEEAGLVTYFRPLIDARAMGKGKYEISALQWKTGIDDADAAWNDTFVHPDSTHWLFEGDGLQFPGLMGRAGVGEKTDLGLYFTKSPGANYGFLGAQLQRQLLGGTSSDWAASARASFVSLYGPEDVDFTVYGIDFLASRTVRLTRWASVSPYAGLSSYLAHSHEKSTVVSLADEIMPGSASTLGATLQLSAARLGVEYSFAKVNSFSMKVGVGF